MKTLFEYDAATGAITDAVGVVTYMTGMMGFPIEEPQENTGQITLNLVKLGVTPDEIIKLKNNDLI